MGKAVLEWWLEVVYQPVGYSEVTTAVLQVVYGKSLPPPQLAVGT